MRNGIFENLSHNIRKGKVEEKQRIEYEDAVSVEMAGLSIDDEANDDDGLVFEVDDGVVGQDDP